jgi:hypothetical protein
VNDDDEQRWTNIHALRKIQTHSLNIQAVKAYTSDCTANGAGTLMKIVHYMLQQVYISVNFLVSLLILVFSFLIECGMVQNILSFRCLQKKKTGAGRSRDQGGHGISPK